MSLFLSTYSCGCRELLLHVITPNDTNTLCRTPQDEGSVRRRDLCLTTHNSHKRERDIYDPAGLEPAITPSKQPQIHALDVRPPGSIRVTSKYISASVKY